MYYHQPGESRNFLASNLHSNSNESWNCRVYIIELSAAVTCDPAFIAKNPQYVPGSPAYYVGMTSLSPEERFLEHKHGIKNVSRIAHEFGRCLRMDLVPDRKPTRRKWAMNFEKRVARDLRAKGFGAWQA